MEDDAHRGRAHAGHVEVLLASWYALEMTRRVTGARRDAPLAWLLPRLRRVKAATTLGAARCAVVMIDHQPCLTCLKFINRLYQHTGVYFAVQGSVGVGPTLATKDPRDNLRLDTFGDVFPVSDGEGEEEGEDDEMGDDDEEGDEEEVEEVVPETPAVARNATAQAGAGAGSKAVAIPPQPFPWMADPRRPRTPEQPLDSDDDDDDDVAHAARVVMEQITHSTPARPRMAWPIPGSAGVFGSRQPRTPRGGRGGDILRPSRRPENHRELLADYKKKTPVWQWPGYEAVAQLRSEDLRRRLAAATPCPGGDGDEDGVPGMDMDVGMDPGAAAVVDVGIGGGASDEDMIIVDPPDDSGSDDAAAYSPGSGSGGGDSSAHPALSASINERVDGRDEGSSSPVSPLANSRVFLYSSFAPIPLPLPPPPRARIDEGGPSNVLQTVEMVPRPDFRMQIDDVGADNDNDNEGVEELEEDDDFYMIGPSSQRARLDDGSMEEEDADEEEVEMVSAHFPAPRPVSFSQWRYQPRARHGKANAPEAPMFQPRPIPNFRGLHRLGRS